LRRVVFSCLFIVFTIAGYSQADSLQVDSLSSKATLAPTIQLPDSLPTLFPKRKAKSDSVPIKAPAQSEIETTINYNARDSIFFDVKNQAISMYGESHIDYAEISLDAEKTTVNWQNQTIKSAYLKDSVGRKVGKPIFSDGKDVYETEDIVYNFKNKRAVIQGVVTEQDGAFMHGDKVKKNENDELFIRDARYTTCSLADPHFFIESSKLKLIPGDKVVSGPFVLKFRSTENKSLTTPLAFPFGMFPQPKKKVSGVIFPQWGTERRRGYYLRNGGYYWAISEYIDLQVTGDIYTIGGSAFDVSSRYKKRYKYGGNFSYTFNRTITDDVEGGTKVNDQWIRWSHTPQTRGRSSFSASVSAGTSSFNQNNNLVNQDFQRSINSQFASNVSFQQRYRWASLSLAARQNQNITTNIQRITFPEMTFNVNRINPLKKVVRNSKSPLAKLNLSHNFVASSEFSNSPVSSSISGVNIVNQNEADSDTLEFFNELDRVFERSRLGGRHTIPISTSLNVLKHFTLSPTFNYQEFWYTKELSYQYDAELNGVRVDTLNQFSRTGNWRTGASINTVTYGTYFVKGKRIEAIRHVITPSLSFSYNPDFSDPSRGVISEVQIDSIGNTRRLSKYEGFLYQTNPPGESQTVGLSLQNNLEMKVRNLKDTTGEEFRKIKIFDNLSASTGYNFAADSFQLSDFSFRARTSLFQNTISINLTGNVDPYIYELISEETSITGNRRVEQRRVNRFAWDAGRGIGQLQRIGSNISLSLSPNTFKRDKKPEDTNDSANQSGGLGTSFFDDPSIADGFGTQDEIAQIQNNPEAYVDFNLPWRLSVNYSISRSKVGFEDPNITQTLAFSGSLALTPKTQVSFNSGYDLEAKDFTTTRISINRDLHCWTLSFNVVPFGRFQSFQLVIQPRDPLLQELKLKRRRNFLDSF